jgi:hypothetical protein
MKRCRTSASTTRAARDSGFQKLENTRLPLRGKLPFADAQALSRRSVTRFFDWQRNSFTAKCAQSNTHSHMRSQ